MRCGAGPELDRSRPQRPSDLMLTFKCLIYWRSLRDSNLCYSLEREGQRVKRQTCAIWCARVRISGDAHGPGWTSQVFVDARS
jgi:hypothetical protein